MLFPVTNTGTKSVDTIYVEPTEDMDYSDVSTFYSLNRTRFVDTKIVPAGQSGIIETVIVVKDTLESIDVMYYFSPNDKDNPKKQYSINLQLKE